jgi:hypothetical protein
VLVDDSWFVLSVNDRWRAKRMIGPENIKLCEPWKDWAPVNKDLLNKDYDSDTYYKWFKNNEK